LPLYPTLSESELDSVTGEILSFYSLTQARGAAL
jgi:hypothetical protein